MKQMVIFQMYRVPTGHGKPGKPGKPGKEVLFWKSHGKSHGKSEKWEKVMEKVMEISKFSPTMVDNLSTFLAI